MAVKWKLGCSLCMELFTKTKGATLAFLMMIIVYALYIRQQEKLLYHRGTHFMDMSNRVELEAAWQGDSQLDVINPCLVNSIAQKLYHNASIYEVQQAVVGLGKCHSIYYPRVPKCGTRTIIDTFRSLARKNHFKCRTSPPLLDFPNLETEHEYIKNISKTNEPYLYSKQTHYMNFTRHSVPKPLLISVIRDPLARLTSSYYYRIHGSSNQTPNNKNLTQCKNKTLDDTVEELGDRLGLDIADIHICWSRAASQLIFFCDNLAACQKTSKSRLNEAIKVLMKDFFIVGLTENLSDFMEALDLALPNFFQGAVKVFSDKAQELSKKYTTRKKSELKESTVIKLKQLLADDYIFYNIARQRFYHLLKKLRDYADSTETY